MPVPSPLRVAVVGSGPAAFFTADHLLKRKELDVTVDMIERLAAPFGLVRFGVAPDHEKIKNVTKQFDRTARARGFRFFGNLEVGRHVRLADLTRHYHLVCFATGAQTDRRLGIPGEDLAGSHPATDFVAWYNGHPDFRDRTFDLRAERVAVVGVGNVAVDVARILCRTPEELAATDIADYAERALAAGRVREVYMLGRRGPAQAAFTNPEVRELGELPGADVHVLPEELALDPASRAAVDAADDRTVRKRLEILEAFARRPRPTEGKPRRLTIRFLVSPVALSAGADGRVASMRLVRNRLEASGGRLRAVPTGQHEDLAVDLVFRSVGYHGVPIPDLPFDERAGIVPNENGRVRGPGGDLAGVYVSGWIKRGPTGVIGTNKADAAETVATMLADVSAGRALSPDDADPGAAEATFRARRPHVLSYDDWTRIDAHESEAGRRCGRPRVKCTTLEEMLRVLDRAR